MKKTVVLLLFIFSVIPLFTQELSVLEKRIIMAGPEEMLLLVMDRSMEKDLHSIISRYEEIDDIAEELFTTFKTTYPGTAEEEYEIMLLKLFLVSALGSADWDNVSDCMGMLEFLSIAEALSEMMDPTEETEAYMNSKYWKDCIAFAKLFDSDSYIKERFGKD